jgi:hypothetical protein
MARSEKPIRYECRGIQPATNIPVLAVYKALSGAKRFVSGLKNPEIWDRQERKTVPLNTLES